MRIKKVVGLGFFSWGTVVFGARPGTWIQKTELFSDPFVLLSPYDEGCFTAEVC